MSAIGNVIGNYSATIQSYEALSEKKKPAEQGKIDKIKSELLALNPADLQKLSPKEAGDMLALIGRLEHLGTTNLTTLKEALTVLANPGQAAAGKVDLTKLSAAFNGGQVGRVIIPKNGDPQPILDLGNIEEDDGKSVAVLTETLKRMIAQPENTNSFVKGMFQFAVETRADAIATVESKNKDGVGTDEINEQSKFNSGLVLGALTNNELAALKGAFDTPKMNNLLGSCIMSMYELNTRDMVSTMSQGQIITFSHVVESFRAQLNEELGKRGLPQLSAVDYSNSGDTIPENMAAKKAFVATVQASVNAGNLEKCQDLLVKLGTATTLDQIKFAIFDLHVQMMPTGLQEKDGYPAFTRLFGKYLDNILPRLTDQQLSGLLNKLESPLFGDLVKNHVGMPTDSDMMVSYDLNQLKDRIANIQTMRAHGARKADHIYGMEGIDFVAPQQSGWTNFKRGLLNFLKTIFCPFGQRLTVSQEILKDRMVEFGQDNGRLLWQLRHDGFSYLDFGRYAYQQISTLNPGMSKSDVVELANIVADELMAASNKYAHDKLGDDPIVMANASKIKEEIGVDVTLLSGSEFTALKERMAMEVTNNPAINTPELRKEAFKTMAQEAVDVAQNKLTKLIPDEPDNLATFDEQTQCVISQVMSGFTDPDKLLTALDGMAKGVNAQVQTDYIAKRAINPKANPPGGDDFGRARADAFKPFVMSMSNAQLRAIAARTFAKDFEALKEGIVLLNQNKSAGSPEDFHAYFASLDMSQLLSCLRFEIKSECLNRGLTDVPFDVPSVDKKTDIPVFLRESMQMASVRFDEQAKEDFSNRIQGLFQTISQNQVGKFVDAGNPGQLADLLVQFHKLTHFSVDARGEMAYEEFATPHFMRELKNLSGEQLLALYKGLIDPSMVELRVALVNKADQDRAAQGDDTSSKLATDVEILQLSLNILEATIFTEIADRSVETTTPSGRLTGGQVKVLGDAMKAEAMDELAAQSDEYLMGVAGSEFTEDDSSAPKLAEIGVTKAEFKQIMDQTEQTINIPAYLIMGGADIAGDMHEPVFDSEHTQLLNYFQTHVDKGAHYTARRLNVEHSQFTALRSLDEGGKKIDGGNHPISSAMNIGKELVGPGTAYSNGFACVLVLKDEVRQRTTFTPSDSFRVFEQTINQAGFDKYKAVLKDYAAGKGQIPLSEATKDKLTDENIDRIIAEMQKKLTEQAYGLGHEKSMEGETLNILYGLLGINPDDGAILDIEAMTAMTTGMAKPTTYEKLDTLLPKVKQGIIDTIKRGHDDDKAINTQAGDYIEGQIFGGVDFAKDVKEIRLDRENMGGSYSREQMDRMTQFCKQFGIKLTIVEHEDTWKQSTCDVMEPAAIPPSVAAKDSSFKAFKDKEMIEILDTYIEHEQTFDVSAIHGRPHICRALMLSNVLANFMKSKGFQVDTYGLFRAVGFHDSGRKSNGVDLGEDDSAKNCQKHLQKHGVTESSYQPFSNIQTNKGVHNVESLILHSADSYDITRLYGTEKFNRDYLAFGQRDIEQQYYDQATGKQVTVRLLKDDPELQAFREALIKEADTLAHAYDPLAEPYQRYMDKQIEILSDDSLTQIQKNEALKMALDSLKRISANTESVEYFANIEVELLTHPEKYPNMVKYYNP